MDHAKALTIAGSDSGGGAGIQADIKSLSALGVYAASAITAITAQNTEGVHAVQYADLSIIRKQIDCVLKDIQPDAVKIGMLGTAEIIRVVRESLTGFTNPIVLDPVMISKSGDTLLEESAIEALTTLLFPISVLITPNIPEAEKLADMTISTIDDMEQSAQIIHAMGPANVIVKGGHLGQSHSADILFDGKKMKRFSAPRVATRNTHGTGCTFSAAITAGLARKMSVDQAVELAKSYLNKALESTYTIGHGIGPVHHFHESPQWN